MITEPIKIKRKYKEGHWIGDLLKCTVCGEAKKEEFFSPHKKEKYRNGKHSACRDCMNKQSAGRRVNKKDDLAYYLIRLLGGLKNKLKHKEKYKSFLFEITKNDVLSLYEKQNGKCAISGIKMTHFTNEGRILYNLSVDRIDSDKGYTIDNIQLLCTIINTMKSTLSNEEFVEICKLIVDNQITEIPLNY